jgi:hypothetical protein
MIRWVLLCKASELTGYSVKALEKKIERGVFGPEGRLWRKDPDGRIHINLEA